MALIQYMCFIQMKADSLCGSDLHLSTSLNYSQPVGTMDNNILCLLIVEILSSESQQHCVAALIIMTKSNIYSSKSRLKSTKK